MVLIMVDIVLVKANNQKKIFQALSHVLSGIEPPLWLILNAAYLRDKGYSVAVVDAEAENLDFIETVSRVAGYKPKLISVVVCGTNPSASTVNMPGAGQFLELFKKTEPQIPTAICGLHPSALPERTAREEKVDFVIVGEGYYTHAELLEAVKAGVSREEYRKIKGLCYKIDDQVILTERQENVKDLGTLPMPAWDLLPMAKYRAHNWHCFSHIGERRPYAVLYTSLGCPFHCDFCCINSIFGGPGIRYRPTDKVIEEIDYLVKNHDVKNIKVLDELFAMNWPHVEAICDQLILRNYDLNIWVYGRIDTVKDYMLAKMKKAGINWIAYGMEAGSAKVRAGVTKGRFDNDMIKSVVDMTHNAGIEVVSNFIFGLPDDDLSTMQETLTLAKELNCAYANFYCAMAYPGSKLYDEAVQKKWPLPSTWLGYAQFSEDTFPLPTKYLSSGQVLRFRDDAFDDYYSDPRYLARMEKLFGPLAVEHIKEMGAIRLRRKYYNS
ncbi:MAG: cobalamin-dependent protein [Candidatus Omnitrophica bacterium]|nr:cobalamin-dependent protein [Candidatus Omnitrophota bacterium]